MTCLTSEQIEWLACGAVEPGDRERLRAHIDACDACRLRLQECCANQEFLTQFLRLVDIDSPVTDENVPPPNRFPGYQILREIYRGPRTIVYEAIQLPMQRPVALKVLLEGPFSGPEARARFEREVKLIARFRHNNIVAVHDSGTSDDKYYFAMDFIRGLPLDAYVRDKRPPVREIVELFCIVCEAVSYAHRRGVIHRDLKPANIVVADDGTPYVLDFGLAKPLQPTEADRVSIAGQIVGTLAYMPPEQTYGEIEDVDTRADVYSLGVILFELLTGTRPYPVGPDLARTLEAIRSADLPPPSTRNASVDGDLDAIVLRAGDKEPPRRYDSAAEMRNDLLKWLEGLPVDAKPRSSFHIVWKLVKRQRLQAAAVALVAVTLIAFASITAENYLQVREARARQAVADRAAVEADRAVGILARSEPPLVRRLYLGWFLLEWQQGRLGQARRLQERLPAASPEHAAMTFLLDDAYPVERLLKAVPADSKPLAYFVAGERASKAGRRDEAIRWFEASLREDQGGWYRSAVEARLAQLGGDGSAAVEKRIAGRG